MPANSVGGGGGASSVTSTAVIGDNQIVRGDGGVRGVQGSSLSVADFNGDITGPVTVSNTSAVGGGFTNQPAGDTITLVSSNAGDTTQQATILYSLAGVVSLENITLNGTTPVVSTAVPDKLLALVLNASCAGTITAKETSGGLTITTITTTNLSKGLFNFTSMDGYGRQFSLVASGATTKDVGIGGFNTAGATQYGFNTLAGTTPVLSSASFGSASQLYIGDVENTVTVTVSSRGGVVVAESLIVGSGLDSSGAVKINGTTGTIFTAPGTALTEVATAPTATIGASQVGKAITLTASPAVASTNTAGAAAGGAITLNSGAAARNTSGNADGGTISLTGGAGIGTGITGLVTLNTATTVRAAIPQDGSKGLLNVEATATPNATGSPTTLRVVTTGAGSSTGSIQGFVNYMLGGYTGSSATLSTYTGNENAGTNTTLGGGNSAYVSDLFTATTGHTYGTINKVQGSTTLNVGNANLLGGNNSAGGVVASLNLALNAGAGTKNAGVFALQSTLPTLVNAAILVDNGAIANPIAVMRDNGAALPTTGPTATFAILDGANAQAGNAVLTSGTMTAENQGLLTRVVHSYTWTNAMVTALGAATAGDILVCTLPAKTVVLNAYVVILTAAGTATTLTVSLGRTSASYIDYIVASDAKAAANTVYGDASAERGTNLTGYDLPSYTGTTAINAHFISTVQNLSAVTTSTGRIILETVLVP